MVYDCVEWLVFGPDCHYCNTITRIYNALLTHIRTQILQYMYGIRSVNCRKLLDYQKLPTVINENRVEQ